MDSPVTRTLSARTCNRCQLITIPGEPFACERCGAPGEEHTDTECDSAGTIRGVAVVHHHPGKEPPTPFTVVEVQLDAGPVIRTQLIGSQLESAHIGSRVVGAIEQDRVAMMLESEGAQ
jgi:hypothetical protein